MEQLEQLWRSVAGIPFATTLVSLCGLLLAAWLAHALTRGTVLRVVERLVQASPWWFDDALLARRVPARLVHAVPALVVAAGVPLVPGLPEELTVLFRNVALACIAVTLAMAVSGVLDALNDAYVKHSEQANARPIKGYLQLVKIAVFAAAFVVAVATLMGQSPLLLLSGLGAMSAVLMLVFKDTILSLVASVQMQSNDMLRVGDWIEMPSLGADGDVIDIALNTVKVQNWDKTITTIPTWRLISESFKNWRGMQESGGRRIKRALLLDQTSVRFLTTEERERLRRIGLLDAYLEEKRREVDAYNARLGTNEPLNQRRLTNVGTFRAYVLHYLKAHPGVNDKMTTMVRQLAPGPTGLPLEIYCFTNTVSWVPYEGIQADIFDHLLAILPEFGLRLYQAPSGADLSAAAGPGPVGARPELLRAAGAAHAGVTGSA